MAKASIIIRTFNEGRRIEDLLRAVKEQDYKDREIIVVDSGSTDNTLKIAKDLGCSNILEIKSHDFTFGYSLNIGCQKAKGKYLVFISAHARPVNSSWLGALLAPFKNEKVAMVYGGQIGDEQSKFSEKRDFKKIFYPNNANAAVRKDLWEQRRFDEYLFGLEDIEWAKHITSKGLLVHYEPKAAIYHIHQEKWAQVFNRYRREAIAAARIGLACPPQASPNLTWFASNLFQDVLASLPNVSLARLEEISRFRYYQWKGSRQGWLHDRDLDLNRERQTLFYPTANKSVVIKSKNHAVLENFPLPEMKPGDILIQVNYAGVCRTDFEVYKGNLGYYKKGLAGYPIVPGHEFSGTIVRIGANNRYRERFKVGEKVVGECVLSRDSNSERQEVGVINHNGAYSQFILLPGRYLHKVPEGLDLKTASLAEPLAVALRAIKRIKSRLEGKNNIAILGAGPIGNFCAQALSNAGHQVAVFDKNRERLEILKEKVKAISRSINNLETFDVIIEATGAKEVLEKILRESRQDGTILLLGFPYGSINYNFEDLVGQEKVIFGSVGGSSEEFEEALKMLPKLDTASFTKTVLPLEEFSKAWDLHRSQKHLKIILQP